MPLKVDQCCCGCTLRTGTILIAVYYIVTSSFVIAVSFVGISIVRQGSINNTTQVVNKSNTDHIGRTNTSDAPFKEYLAAGATTILMMYAISSALSILLNVMLLVGTQTENVRLIYMWIVTHVIYLVISVVGLLTNIFMSLLNVNERASSVSTTLMTIVLTFYFLVVVSSFYQQLKDRQNGTLPEVPPVVVYIDHQAAPPPYSELYPPWPPQHQQQHHHYQQQQQQPQTQPQYFPKQ